MKKLIYITLPFALVFTLTSCGGKSEEVKEEQVEKPSNPLEALENLTEDSQESQDAAEKKIAERKAKGDTLAMHYEELMKYLPGEIAGYNRGEPDGTSMNQPGVSFSTADVRYTNEKDEEIHITIIDYNQAYGMYTAATALWAMGMSVDTPEEKSQGVKFEGEIGGWEEFNKKTGRTVLTLGVGYRFWVQIEADAQKDTENVKAIAKKIDLKKLSEI
jgi:hypothetical protein